MNKSRTVILTLLCFLLGVFFGDWFKLSYLVVFAIAIGFILALLIYWQETAWRFTLLAILGFLLGLGFISFWQGKNSQNIAYNTNLTFESPVLNYPVFATNKAQYIVRYQGKNLQLSTGRFPEYRYGDKLKISGQIKKPSAYLSHQNISGQITAEKVEKVGFQGNFFLKTIYLTKERLESVLNRVFPEPEASFAAGLILGSKRNIPDSLMADFNRTGTTHIVAVSGYNVTILVIWLGLFFGIFSRKFKIWGSLAVILIFVLMTGASASVVRAGILASLVIFGKSQGRRTNMTILILLAAAIMVLKNPYVLKYDISFQLSFSAFLGLIYLAPALGSSKYFKFLPQFFRQTLVETLSAQLMVLPFLIYYFGQASLISPVANLLILWLIPALMLLVFLSALVGKFVFIGYFIVFLTNLGLSYIIYAIEQLAKAPWASILIPASQWWWMPVYFILIGFFLYQKRNQLILNLNHEQT